MQIHELQPLHKFSDKKRIGRSGKRGTYSGRGQKGQGARSGHKIRPANRDYIQRLPKLRGIGNRGILAKKKKKVENKSDAK